MITKEKYGYLGKSQTLKRPLPSRLFRLLTRYTWRACVAESQRFKCTIGDHTRYQHEWRKNNGTFSSLHQSPSSKIIIYKDVKMGMAIEFILCIFPPFSPHPQRGELGKLSLKWKLLPKGGLGDLKIILLTTWSDEFYLQTKDLESERKNLFFSTVLAPNNNVLLHTVYCIGTKSCTNLWTKHIQIPLKFPVPRIVCHI